MNATMRIAWIAIRELLYEKVFYIFFSFSIVALIVSLLLGQMTYAEQAKLTLDFMLAGTQFSMVLFSIFMGISLFQREITIGTVAMVLSKPVSRSSFVLGKFCGQLAIQTTVTFAMSLITILLCANLGSTISYTAILQSTLLTVFEIIVVSSITYFFAVNTGSVTAALGTGLFFLLGHFTSTIDIAVKNDSSRIGLWKVIKGVLPNLDIFNMKALASYGISITWTEVNLAFIYALTCGAMFLMLACLSFSRKDLFT